MITLTTTQETTLKAASARADGSIHPMPTNIRGGAAKKVIDSLKAKGMINDDGTITEEGRNRTGECGKYSGQFPSMNAAIQADLAMATEAPEALALADAVEDKDETEAKLYADAEKVFMSLANACAAPTVMENNNDFKADVDTNEHALAEAKPSRTRDNTKKAKVIELMKRPEGATAAQIAEATGWQPHTIRGFLSIAKKKMGLAITTNRLRIVGPNQQGSPGSFTTYFL